MPVVIMPTIKIIPTGETALACILPPPAALEKQQRLWAFADAVHALPETEEAVTGMNNLTVFVRPGTNLQTFSDGLEALWSRTESRTRKGRHVRIPVVYGGEFGEDLAEVAAFHKTGAEEIVRRHTKPVYTVFMMGFQPGFPYLGGLPENLHTPRRAVPRIKVPAGSVGIGGSQTGVYPFASPGGWQLIGRTEAPLFRADAEPPVLLAAGDTVQFVAERVWL